MHMNTHKMPRFSAHQKNKNNLLLIVSGPIFKKEVEAIREKFSISKKEGSEKWGYEKLLPFKESLLKLCRSFKLPKNYDHYVERHILFGEVNAPLNNFDICPSPDSLIPDEARYISINVYAKLTDIELEDLKKEVKTMGKMLPSLRPIKNIEEKIESEKLFVDRDDFNAKPDREYVLTIAEMSDEGQVKQVYEHKRELKELREKFGK